MGRNFGARTTGAQAEQLIERLETIATTDGPVTLIGVSLGGMIARLVAHRRPDLVREVITISSPFAGSGKALIPAGEGGLYGRFGGCSPCST